MPSAGDYMLALKKLCENTARVQNAVEFRSVSATEISCIVRKMKSKKSCGYDEIPISIIKDNIDLLDKSLALFFNQCFEDCTFPDQLKIKK